ncbi:MAG: FkbM family methyltransferase [Paraclostridium bifermentans]|uniref:FkbM family methyltransferase n=1 Tax=Paraclostridium bifermentans TaxID=1490 RepID=UPI001DD3AA2D|nr:FkbM family methyltransferase [Paraclostridium bifermentans]MBS6506841.1 FkbM family methyltransferase [Paraclostridium bifermentans]
MITDLEKVYRWLCDLESKEIFLNRLNYNITGDFRYISNIVDKYVQRISDNFSWKNLTSRIKNLTYETKIVIYGAGGEGDALYWILKSSGIEVDVFCDRNTSLSGSKIIPVISPKQLFDDYKSNKIAIVIGTEMYFDEIYKFLIQNGIRKEDIYGGSADTTKQYFDKELLSLTEKECFVDCGALDLQTTMNFLSVCCEGKSYAFEPDISNFERCMIMKDKYNLSNIEIYNHGCGSKKECLKFTSTQNGSSCVSDDGNTEISIERLDQVLKSKEITFIKMDIEGMELEALKGSIEIIKKHKPKLAISIYHKNDDLINIPIFIKNLVPEYKLYIRHYSIYPAETILYAVI